jgi:hypothetical protein
VKLASGAVQMLVEDALTEDDTTTARYAHLADDPVKAASDAVGRYIAAAMNGGTSGAPRSRRTTPEPDR